MNCERYDSLKADQVRLERKRPPDPAERGLVNAQRLRQRRRRPVGRILGRGLQGRDNDPFDLLIGELRCALGHGSSARPPSRRAQTTTAIWTPSAGTAPAAGRSGCCRCSRRMPARSGSARTAPDWRYVVGPTAPASCAHRRSTPIRAAWPPTAWWGAASILEPYERGSASTTQDSRRSLSCCWKRSPLRSRRRA